MPVMYKRLPGSGHKLTKGHIKAQKDCPAVIAIPTSICRYGGIEAVDNRLHGQLLIGICPRTQRAANGETISMPKWNARICKSHKETVKEYGINIR